MQDAGDADFGAEVLGVGGNGEHGLRRGPEQEIVNHGLVLVGDNPDLGGQREDDVEVGNDRLEASVADGPSQYLHRLLGDSAVEVRPVSGTLADESGVSRYCGEPDDALHPTD